MKRYIKNTTISMLTLSILLVTSCVYDEADHLIEGKGPNILRAYAGPDQLAVAESITSTVTLAQIWKDGNSAKEMNKAVSITFSTSAEFVTAYNEENGTEYLPLPEQYFTFSPSTLEIGADELYGEIQITMNAAGLDLSQDYAIGLVMNADDWQSGGHKFIKVALPSAYEGFYHSYGTRYNYNTTADANVTNWPPSGYVSTGPWDFASTQAFTLSSKTVAVHAANANYPGGFGRINLTVTSTPFDSDNNGSTESFVVDIVPNADIGLNALVKSTHRESYYTPGTKTFKLYYEYTNATGTFRNLEHNLVKLP